MRALKFTCLVFSLIAFLSCKKDNNRDTTTDGNYIDKIYSLVDNGTGVDTALALSVTYDNLKRVTLMTNGTDENWTYFYSGNDMNPYKAVIESYGGGPDTVYFTYNSAGLKIKDSVLQGPNPASISTVTEYSYETGKIISYAVNNISNFSRDTATTDANGNILSNWLHRYYTPPVTEYYTVHSVFTYDNHPHPFSAMNIFNSNRNLPFGETFAMEMFTPNNRLTQDEVSGMADYHATYSYEYNANGFPSKITDHDFGVSEITLITYRNL